MTETSNEEVKALQRDVQRLLGRCMLRLQQYERLIRAITVEHDISGPIRDFETIRAARADRRARKTLGALIGELLGSFLVSSETKVTLETVDDGNDGPAVACFRMQLRFFSEEDLAQTVTELKELVHLRNNLVHHFIDQHDLWSAAGCNRAQAVLIADYDRIDQCYARLRDWAGEFERARQYVADHVRSETCRNLVIHGIMPDGTVDWPASSFVSNFREAAQVLAGSEGKWVSVEEARRWIVEKYPDQTPERFGCKTWQQALQESKLFDLLHVKNDDRRVLSFRVKANPKILDTPERTWMFDGSGGVIQKQ